MSVKSLKDMSTEEKDTKNKGKKSFFERFSDRISHLWDYCYEGVWRDTRRSPKVNFVKTLNLSVRSFFNADIQTQACAMTFRTMLAIVPALALIFAFGRGFGLENVIEDELVATMPSQAKFLRECFKYVDSYLDNSSEGLFLGIGIVFLLWTLVSLLSSIEDAFNQIWGVRNGRSWWRKISDYLIIFILLPVLLICASGVTAFVTTSVEGKMPGEQLSPIVSILLDVASLVAVWFFFTGLYIMVPNTKVKFRQAFVSGVFAGTAFEILQWLFMTGQLYVSKYNAVYGGFAFLPLLLIWLQLVWVITLAGSVVCYASQNFSQFNFGDEIKGMSTTYRSKIMLSVMVVAVDRYRKRLSPMTEMELSTQYGLPASLVGSLINKLLDTGLLLKVVTNDHGTQFGYVPSIDPELMTVGDVIKRLRDTGTSEFVPEFDKRFKAVVDAMSSIETSMIDEASKFLVKDLDVMKVDA